ncbi:hypothetical protein HN51_030593 [Arachis hypogaea]
MLTTQIFGFNSNTNQIKSKEAKRSVPALPDSNSFPPNGSSKRARSSSKTQPPPLSVPQGHVAFRLLCQASRIGGVIGKSGSVIKSLQQSTGTKIRIEDAPAEVQDRLIVVVGEGTISGRVSLSGGEAVEVSKAQEALLKVFDRILEVAAETEGIEVGDRVVCSRLVADAAQVGSVIGKGGKIVDKIRKDTGCRIRAFTDNSAPSTSSSDEVIEIEGNVSSVKKALLAVSRRLQDFPPPDRTKMMGSKPYEVVQDETLVSVPHHETLAAVQRESFTAVPHETFTTAPRETLNDLHVDHLLQRSSLLSSFSSSSNSYATGIHSLSVEDNIGSSLEPKAVQLEVCFRILCSNDRVGGVIGKGGAIVKALQNETGATISIGPLVGECEDRVITVTASENSESKYSPAQKAVVLVYSRSIEAGIEKGLDSGFKGSSVTARLLVPSNQVGCLLGKGGVIVSEMRKATGASIRIIGSDQAPKCSSDNDQVVQISGEFSSVQDALYNATGRLRDNLIISSQNSAGTRSQNSVRADSSLSSARADTSLSSARADTSPYGRLRDTVSLSGQPAFGVSPCLTRHTLSQSIDHHALAHNLDHSLGRHSLSQSLDHHALPYNLDHSMGRHVSQSLDRHALVQNLDHSLSRHSLSQSLDDHAFAQNLDHSLGRHNLSQSIDHHALAQNLDYSLGRHGLSQGNDHHALSWNVDHPSSPGLWAPSTVAGINSRGINDLSWGMTSRKGGLELVSGSKSAIVTSTTVEIVVPDDTIDSVYGENGSNLARLRQISGAKVVIHEPRPGTSDRTIVISGTPDETQAAQSLLQAFILSGSS